MKKGTRDDVGKTYHDPSLVTSARSFGVRQVVYKANTVKEPCDPIHRLLTNIG